MLDGYFIWCLRSVDLGRFGKFKVDDILGKPLGIPYQIYDRDRVRMAPPEAIFDDYG